MSIGSLSAKLGCDIRELWMAGYSDEQIFAVVEGKMTLAELLRSEPAGNDRTPTGQEILAAKYRPRGPHTA